MVLGGGGSSSYVLRAGNRNRYCNYCDEASVDAGMPYNRNAGQFERKKLLVCRLPVCCCTA
jgi:hypothetical protein